MGLGRRKTAHESRRARRALASFRSTLTSFAVALALLVQLIAMPYQQAMAGPAAPDSNTAAIAADLKAIFGDAAGFCARIDDKAPSPHGPCNHCDDQCPLCRSLAQSATLLAPDAPALSIQLNASPGRAIVAAPLFGGFSACPAQRNRARAPPLAV